MANIHLYHGDDEVAMRDEIAKLQSKLGDAITAEMNTARFEGSSTSIDTIRNAAQAAPFLSEGRLIIVTGAAKAFSAAEPRPRFTRLLEDLPETTTLVLVENTELEEKNWLLKWAQSAGGRAQARKFQLPQGGLMAAWLQQRARELGGELRPQAAAALSQLIGRDKTAAAQEIEKLLAYTGYSRPIEAADVAALSLPSGEQGDFFALIDALGAGNAARAMQMLQALMQERDLIMLYFSLVGHFRLLLQTRELVEARKADPEIAQALGIHPYRAQKLAAQARRFSLGALEAIYKRLLDLDEQIKTGEIEPELAMETFVAGLSVAA
ncbi:MAG: DNA polymerase III subunit delta [Anaerolineales bacterium]